VDVDITSYGRMPPLLAHFISTLRTAYGDFSMIDPKQGFDLSDAETGEKIYSRNMMIFTFFLWVVASFVEYMILMNFIIAVISDSYMKVIENTVAHDYKERVTLIYERENHFTEKDFNNQIHFPNILIVRKRKSTDEAKLLSQQGQYKQIKQQIKDYHV